MWGTRVRDRDFETRMTEMNVIAGQAGERAGAADERAATLEKQAAQLRLDLEKERTFREPRKLTQTQQNSISRKINTFAGTGFVMYVQLSPEPIDFLLQLSGILRTSKWLQHPSVPPNPTVTLPNLVPIGQSLSFFGEFEYRLMVCIIHP
jgi:hypothetical protein